MPGVSAGRQPSRSRVRISVMQLSVYSCQLVSNSAPQPSGFASTRRAFTDNCQLRTANRLPRQRRRSHQEFVDGARGLPALADRPHDERLPAPHVARGEHFRHGGAVGLGVRLDVACARRARRRIARAGPRARDPTKPIANSTRSAWISNSLPGISTILGGPLPSRCHSTRAAMSFSTLPSRPSKRLVVTDQSRSQPSSCDDDVRSLIGQLGHTSGLFSDSGRLRQQLELRDRRRTMAIGRAHAVRAGVAAADDHDVLARAR